MFCSIYKWFISQALDSGNPFSSLASRHLRRCAVCREFAQFSESLKQRGVQDTGDFLAGHDEALDKKIISGLSKSPERRKPSARNPILIPAVAAASALLIIAISVIWLTAPESRQMDPLKSLYEFDINQASLESKLASIDSPLQEEIKGLREALNSTAKFLVSCLEYGLGEEPYQEKN